jgi:hypothetical protein
LHFNLKSKNKKEKKVEKKNKKEKENRVLGQNPGSVHFPFSRAAQSKFGADTRAPPVRCMCVSARTTLR